jgi:hypothetical protein
VTHEDVERAIRDGVRFLRQSQQPNGYWGGQEGTTELVLLALLTAGESADDPAIARALALSRNRGYTGHTATYATALQTMALATADPASYRDVIARNALWLERTQIRPWARGAAVRAQPGVGSWTYGMNRAGQGDNSNSQYAVLGLNAAEEAGVEVAREVWLLARRYWEVCQQFDGGWAYTLNRQGSTASMTCAGVSSLVITGERLFRGLESLHGAEIRHCGHGGGDLPLARGVDWLGTHFRVDQNVGGTANWKLYYLYGLERAGRLTGLRYFGGHDWYREGAEELVASQDRRSGAWTRGGGGPVIDTSFALLFLAKGRAPVLIHKLRHGPGADWDNDRDDARNLTALVSRDWKHLLTWQVVDAETADVEGLLMAPIAFFNGHEPPGFRKFVAALLPGHALEPIPRDDLLYTRKVGYDLAEVRTTRAAGGKQGYPELEGVKLNGHWAVIYSKLDIGCALERPQGLDCPGYTHESAVQIAANIVLYSTLP